MSDYNQLDLRYFLDDLGVMQGDNLFIHSNIGYFGRCDGVLNSNHLCNIFLEELLNSVGNLGSIIVPTFTYSFQNNLVFDPIDKNTNMGFFSNHVLNNEKSIRTIDPAFSVAFISNRSDFFHLNYIENSFGVGSFFEYFDSINGKILNFNLDAGSTYLHYLERVYKAPYRFDKSFTGYLANDPIKKVNTIFVRDLQDNNSHVNFENFTSLALKDKVYRTNSLGRGFGGIITVQGCRDMFENYYLLDNWFLTKKNDA